jgi:NADH:ubiquinone oxidoreductase subunit
MWLHRIREQPPSKEEMESKGRLWKSQTHPGNLTGTAKRYYPPGHFFNPQHRNQQSVFATEPEQADYEANNNEQKEKQ